MEEHRFMEVYLQWTSAIMISFGSVSDSESKNVCIMSVCSDLTLKQISSIRLSTL